MDKRKFLKVSGIAGAGLIMAPLSSCNPPAEKPSSKASVPELVKQTNMEFLLPELGFDYSALEPHIDARTMEIHHSKHHAGYVKKLNAALKASTDVSASSLTELMSAVTMDTPGLRNNGGGHFNHSLFWECLKPGGAKAPEGKLAEAINAGFGSFEEFKTVFFNAAKTRFGSGWGWLSVNAGGKLFVSSTPNQDNPLMGQLAEEKGTPILGIDVWEHAYYLKYQNLRGDYISAFMDLINWDVVAKNFHGA